MYVSYSESLNYQKKYKNIILEVQKISSVFLFRKKSKHFKIIYIFALILIIDIIARKERRNQQLDNNNNVERQRIVKKSNVVCMKLREINSILSNNTLV